MVRNSCASLKEKKSSSSFLTFAYNSLEEFKAQYTGVWDPSDGHWFGLDFIYKGKEYRFNTGSMYSESNTILEDGREASFGLYKKNNASQSGNEYTLLAEFATIEEALSSTCIDGIRFDEIIKDPDTELVGQD
jgi:hypothetical protein